MGRIVDSISRIQVNRIFDVPDCSRGSPWYTHAVTYVIQRILAPVGGGIRRQRKYEERHCDDLQCIQIVQVLKIIVFQNAQNLYLPTYMVCPKVDFQQRTRCERFP